MSYTAFFNALDPSAQLLRKGMITSKESYVICSTKNHCINIARGNPLDRRLGIIYEHKVIHHVCEINKLKIEEKKRKRKKKSVAIFLIYFFV